MESTNEDSDDFEYKWAFAALDELRLGGLKPFFKEQFLQDDTLFFMNSEEELRNFPRELGLPFGQGFKFSRVWFNKYHKRAETLDAPTPETSGRRQENVQTPVKFGGVTTLKNVQKKEDINGSPFNLAPASLENENSAQTNPVSHLVIETTSRRSDTATTMQQPEKEDETVVQSTLKETSKIPRETAMSVSMLSPAECRLTQELRENNQDFTGVQHDRSSQKCQSELEEIFTQKTPKTDSTFVIENRNDEPENAYFTGRLSPKTPNVVFEEGQTFEVIQETPKVLRDENNNGDSRISDSMKLLIKTKEPENGHGDLLNSSASTEDTVAMTANNDLTPSDDDVDMLTHQTDLAVPAATNVCRKENTDQNVTTCTRNKEAAQEEACKTEDHVQEDYGPYQRATSDHKVQDFKGTSFSKSQERTTEKDASPYAVNKRFLEVDSHAVDHREDETSKTDKVDDDLKTTVSQTDVSDQEVQGSNDATANESQEKTTRVDVASEQKQKDINDSPFDLTPANPKNEDSAPTEGPPISDQVVETTSRRSHTGKFTMPQQKKEDGAVVQSTFTETSKIPLKTAMCVSTLSPVECRLTQELQENKQDVTGIQHARSNQKYQPELEEMFTQTTPKQDSTFVIENRNDEPENAYFTGQLSPKTPKEVFKDGQAFEVIQETVTVLCDENSNDDSCISDSMKLLIKAKEPQNGQGDLLSSSATTEDTVTMTANNELTPSDDDVDLLTHQTDQLVKDFKGTSFSRSQEITTETDVSPLAVSKGFLEVDFDAVDHREDETSKTDKVDKVLNTTVNHTDVSDHEVQRASDTTANESQENITKENQANEKAAATKIGVDNEPEDYTSIAAETGSSNGKTELRVLLSDTVSSNKEGNHQLTSKQEGKRNRIKSKVVGVVESHEQSEKENTTSLEEKSLATNDSDSYTQEGEKELDVQQEDKMGDMFGGYTTLIDENGNILKRNPTTMMKTSESGVAISDAAGPLISKEKTSGSEKLQSDNFFSSHDAKESSGTSLKQEITAASSNQRIGPEGQNNLLETENFKEVSEPALKCIPRPFGVKGKDTSYPKGSVLDAEENREVEFKSLGSAQPSSLPWKIMDKAKKFICACLNADSKGIIYFGVGDCQEQNSKFNRGEILGLDVEDMIDDIMKAFQCVLDDHIKSDDGPLKKGGDQSCINVEFIPVTSKGERTKLYVVEIEVSRDWKLCKDNVYYSKCWTEKRGVKIEKDLSTKKLSDFYKVFKDEFDDVAIRTSGASSSVKQHEVNRQVKEPLTAKYKEWKREAKLGTSESTEGPIPDDSDVTKFSTLVRERLRDMNSKDFGYILIANKLPPQYRGTPHLAFLQNIPWLAVFDLFDAASKKDGLHYVCNETTDAPRAKLRSLDDFKEVSSDWISGNDFTLPTRGTTWILNNEEMQKGGWIKCCRDCVYRALSAYKLCFPQGRLLCVFLGLSENAVKEMVDIMECCFSIFGNSASNCVTIISESKIVAEAFIKSSEPSLQKELRECSVSGIPWSLLKEIVREMVGPTKFEERGARTELPYFNGQLKEVLNKAIHSWDDLEVYIPNPRLPSSAEDIEKARNAFYKGAQATQTNLFHNHCIARTHEEETNLKIEHALKSLSKPSKDLGCHVKTVTVPYEPGSGATTLCRRILWNKRKDYRCAVVKAITSATDYQIEQLQGIIYDEKNINFSPPALVLVDNFPENETRRLTEKIRKRQTKCVILSTFPIGKLSANTDFDITSLRQLDEKEMSLVKDILINITSDSERRRGAEEVLEREKRFIWFGLELFGRDYDKIEKRLQNHIKSTLDFLGDSQEIHEMVLNFCCFLHYYSDGRAILPHPVASDFLYEASDETDEECALMQHIHKIFGGLLLEGFNETNGYYGWRPAHSLVSEVVKSRISIEDTAILLLEKIHKGKAYVNKFLKEQVFKLFLDRKRISDTVVLEDLATDDGSIDSDFESEVVGFYEVRTRYSPLIVDILEGDDGIRGALRLLITICQKASQPEGKAYAWQQLARFMGYEMRANEMDSKDDLHHRLYTTMNKEEDVKLSMPETGIEAAHVAVDIAINQQPKYSHHYVTKGVLYLLQLRDFKPEELPNLPCSLPAVIDICRKALDVYDKALSTTQTLNHYSMIGKIQAIVSLLEIVKGLPFFRLESERFTRYLKKFEIPRELEGALKQEEHSYVQGLSTRTLALLNELFGDVKLRQMTTFDEKEIRGLSNAKIRASKLRRTFYEVTGFDRSELSEVEVPLLSSHLTRDAPALYQRQQVVQDILFKHDETPYSSWANLGDGDVSRIYNLLQPLCLRGYGSQDDLLIFCKACLRMKERPPIDELDKTVSKWVAKYPSSEWAHLFNYMIHFPIPNGSLAASSPSAKLSIKKCDKIVRDKTGIGFRKSGAEYFLGKGIGLYAFVTSQEFQTKWENKTDFWRSKDISEKLERVCGQKDVNFKGVITYQGIQLRFDDTRYPKESKDDLWFYIGFSVAGPYAYDPVDNDTYDILRRKTSESVSPDFPAIEAATSKDNSGISVSKRGEFRELRHSITKRRQGPDETKAENLDVLTGDYSGFPCSTPRLQPEKPISSSMPHFLNAVPSGCRDNPIIVSSSTLSSSSKSFSADMSSWGSADNLHRPTTPSKWVSYASALQLGSARPEEQMTKAVTKQQQSGACNLLPTKDRNWKTIQGTRVIGKHKQVFQPRYVDKTGKLHHGSWVLGAEKSKECKIHTGRGCDITSTTRCPFAHSWRGDTLQHVCTKCTRNYKPVCKERINHKMYIWNLGPYRKEDGTIWKDPPE